ncbi:MAG: hypothetical protein ACI304_04020 [Lepagella sp.]
MKIRLFYHTLLSLCLSILTIGCSDAIPEYAQLDELSISLDQTLYTYAVGDMMHIEPIISGTLPEDDLIFDWEVGQGEGYGDHARFTPFARMRNLIIECSIGPNFPSPAIYTLRVHVRQPSTGREFYSPHFNLKITGKTGLMVLYDTNEESDIALIRDFTNPEKGSVSDTYFSSANDNQKIPGKGIFLTQLQGGDTSFANYHAIIAVTDQTSVGADYLNMSEIPDGWNKLLFIGDFNRRQPENIVYTSSDPMYKYQEVYIIDGGEIYGRQCREFVLRPALGTSSNAYIDLYDIAPFVYTSRRGSYSVWLFDKKSRGFIGITNIISVFMNGAADPGSVVKVFTPGGQFNPSRMRRDLIYMAGGAESDHLLAVMQDDNNELFVAEINTKPDDLSQTAQALYSFKYDQSEKILGFDFSSHAPSRHCCYFYTSNRILHFYPDGKGSDIIPMPINGNGRPGMLYNEEITVMKTLIYDNKNLMIIATWDGSKTKISCYDYDTDTGDLNTLLSTWIIPGRASDIHLKHI